MKLYTNRLLALLTIISLTTCSSISFSQEVGLDRIDGGDELDVQGGSGVCVSTEPPLDNLFDTNQFLVILQERTIEGDEATAKTNRSTAEISAEGNKAIFEAMGGGQITTTGDDRDNLNRALLQKASFADLHTLISSYRVGETDGEWDDGIYTRKTTITLSGKGIPGPEAVEPYARIKVIVGPREVPNFHVQFTFDGTDWKYGGTLIREVSEETPCRSDAHLENNDGHGLETSRTFVIEDVVRYGEAFEIQVAQFENYSKSFGNGQEACNETSSFNVRVEVEISDDFANKHKADVNGDCFIDFADIPAFISILQSGGYDDAADVNCDGVIDFDDIPSFIFAVASSNRTWLCAPLDLFL